MDEQSTTTLADDEIVSSTGESTMPDDGDADGTDADTDADDSDSDADDSDSDGTDAA
ncbi:MAG: hypothetical protein H0V94_10045 [Actinobacteria bacterium]|nr:hypothetical protein [Actinomycetota bacterium]